MNNIQYENIQEDFHRTVRERPRIAADVLLVRPVIVPLGKTLHPFCLPRERSLQWSVSQWLLDVKHFEAATKKHYIDVAIYHLTIHMKQILTVFNVE